MKAFVLFSYCVVTIFSVNAHESVPADPASRQLPYFRLEHKKPIGVLTTAAGAPVEVRDTNSLNSDLVSNEFFLETIQHINNQIIPERIVHAKGTGAFGYFEVTNDVTEYTKAAVFGKVGKKTNVAVRFSPAFAERGGSDFSLGTRALAIKFYTEEGNLDLLSLHSPIFHFKDPLDFPTLVHSFRRNPATLLQDRNAQSDFVSLRPNIYNSLLFLLSDYGTPRGYRRMDAFPIHTYELYNNRGEKHYVRFSFRTEQGLANFTSAEAKEVGARDPDFFTRDLYDAIAEKNYPSWKLEMDVLKEDIEKLDFDPFDLTRIWPKRSYYIVSIGRVVLNRNPKNQFAEVEQLALNPSNLVPGIGDPPDKVFQSRKLAYRDAHRHRLGINFNKIDINKPISCPHVYTRDGKPPVRDNMKDAPNYFPNSFNGPVPFVDESKPKVRLVVKSSNAVDFGQPAYFYNHILKTDGERRRLVENIISFVADVTAPDVLERTLKLFYLIDQDLGERVAAGLLKLRNKNKAPRTRTQNKKIAYDNEDDN